MTTGGDHLIDRDPLGMTVKELVLRLDARMDRFEPRVRALEDHDLKGAAERGTLFKVIGVFAIFTPLITTVILRVILPP